MERVRVDTVLRLEAVRLPRVVCFVLLVPRVDRVRFVVPVLRVPICFAAIGSPLETLTK